MGYSFHHRYLFANVLFQVFPEFLVMRILHETAWYLSALRLSARHIKHSNDYYSLALHAHLGFLECEARIDFALPSVPCLGGMGWNSLLPCNIKLFGDAPARRQRCILRRRSRLPFTSSGFIVRGPLLLHIADIIIYIYLRRSRIFHCQFPRDVVLAEIYTQVKPCEHVEYKEQSGRYSFRGQCQRQEVDP